ncbi:MAG: hypothetical protein J7K82_03285 [Thermoproteales archaeon]|nr:hypothetical protein [Thermoproteales archaeon]
MSRDFWQIFEGPTKKGLSKLKYYFSQFKAHWKDWTWYYFQFENHILPVFYKFKNNNGIYVMGLEWDNLIILDACRYDVFEKYVSSLGVEGELRKAISRGSSTTEFLKENFSGRKFKDTIYVTANPYVSKMLRGVFYKIVHVWRDYWDEKLGTVHPEAVTKVALETKSLYPDKRLIVHYMQPHTPFIGEYKVKGSFVEVALKHGKEAAMRAYESNLRLVLPYIKMLLDKLDGITVVTSDHGEANGERALKIFPIYGHPTGVRIPVLVEVPWFVVKSRRKHAYEQEDLLKIKTRYKIKRLSKDLTRMKAMS